MSEPWVSKAQYNRDKVGVQKEPEESVSEYIKRVKEERESKDNKIYSDLKDIYLEYLNRGEGGIDWFIDRVVDYISENNNSENNNSENKLEGVKDDTADRV